VTLELAQTVTPYYYWDRWNVHYSMNANVLTALNNYTGWGNNIWLKFNDLTSSCMVLADGAIENDNPPPGSYYFVPAFNSNAAPPLGQWSQAAPWPIDRTQQAVTQFHNGVYNATFADGHVESEKTATAALLAIPNQ
jgi:prepilin-type processing-associated H-X9-DG protein